VKPSGLTPEEKFSGHPLETYYRFHSRIYDATRWIFLFGRDRLIKTLTSYSQPTKILEVGCGTGKNLVRLRETFPGVDLTGLDLSRDMLEVARKKLVGSSPPVELLHQAFGQPVSAEPRFDLLVFSYALSMFNPGWDQAITTASKELVPGGTIAVVDFHNSPSALFKQWMALNHVRMEGHLLPELQSRFRTLVSEVRRAYGGLWYYLLFIGQKTES
jgi:S-adenosylmethionine-diacylgycerolhomoserine-N-methlytransferase